MGVAHALAPAYVEAPAAQRATLGAVAASLLAFRNAAALVAGLLVALAAVGSGHGTRYSDRLPDWLASLAWLAGVLGAVGALWPLAGAFSFVRAIGYVLFLIWAAIAGIAASRSAEPDDGRPAGTAPGAART